MYQLVRETISTDTVKACEEMLDAAKRGHLAGLSAVLILKQRRFMVFSTGAALREPSLTRGLVLALDDDLRDLVHSTGRYNPTI